MPDLDRLTPAERANQLGKPEGEVGIAIGEVMNRTNSQVISAAYRFLDLSDGMNVLEVGFGNGHTVENYGSSSSGNSRPGAVIGVVRQVPRLRCRCDVRVVRRPESSSDF
jgi:hypothetical protein